MKEAIFFVWQVGCFLGLVLCCSAIAALIVGLWLTAIKQWRSM